MLLGVVGLLVGLTGSYSGRTILTGNATLAVAAGTNFLVPSGNSVLGTVETNVQQPIAKAGVLRNLFCHTTVVEGSAKSDAFTLRKNAVSTALTCTMTNALTCSDTTHTVVVAANDMLSIQDVTVGSAITARVGGCSFELDM